MSRKGYRTTTVKYSVIYTPARLGAAVPHRVAYDIYIYIYTYHMILYII